MFAKDDSSPRLGQPPEGVGTLQSVMDRESSQASAGPANADSLEIGEEDV